MKNKLLALSIVTLSAVFSSPQVLADEPKLLGRTIVLEKVSNNAIIPLNSCRYAKEITIRADKDMEIQKAKFTFKNGETRTFSFRDDLKEGERTKWRSFLYKRCIKKIQIFGKADDDRAGVRVYGKH
ncbi:DUF2541 family protein [Vibrio splendidus]|nr:DUF2541 family protein [Vibrio splendidus]MCC4882924.1 DUF2541 family protein [Vibrio splendidus]